MSKILMVASEATPFCKTGGLADVIGSLPVALQQRGESVAVVIPGYRVNHYPGPLREAYRNLWIPLGSGFTVDIYERVERDVTFYFVMCPPLLRMTSSSASVTAYGHPRRRATTRIARSLYPARPAWQKGVAS